MEILFICKASTDIGLGHLIRSKTLAEGLFEISSDNKISFWIIGEDFINNLMQDFPIPYKLYYNEDSFQFEKKYQVVYIDMLTLRTTTINKIKSKSDLIVSLSPVFDQMNYVDVLINRTIYFGENQENQNIRKFGGIKYSLIQKDCQKISTAIYKKGLEKKKISIAISMGGGDAANKTLTLIKQLKMLKTPSVFWVLLGEGYKHSYDELVKEISTVKEHEIILAKTNHSMWSILNNVSLLITTSGVTVYEAVYAGLPSIVFYQDNNRFFLIKELIEKDIIFDGGIFNKNASTELNHFIDNLIKNKNILLEKHRSSKKLIDNKTIYRINKVVEALL